MQVEFILDCVMREFIFYICLYTLYILLQMCIGYSTYNNKWIIITLEIVFLLRKGIYS